MGFKHWRLLAILAIAGGAVGGTRGESILRPGDRIVFVGDSITGRGGNARDGWVALMDAALKQSDSTNHQTLIPLGGSGQTVGSWKVVELKSRTASTLLDVKVYDAQVELALPADVLVIMLGMNDVLAPSLECNEKGYEKWIGEYRTLIAALRERCSPRVIALATPTPCTEDPLSPKNRVMDEMCRRLSALAAEEKCVLLPTRETSWEILKMGRRVQPDFHIANDQVHPDRFGHFGIAAGMLRGFGESAAASAMLEKAATALRPPNQGESLSFEVEGKPESLDGRLRFSIKAYHSPGKAELQVPEGWEIPVTTPGTESTLFVVEGTPDRLMNRLMLRSGGRSCEIVIPAPWLVATANIGRRGWKAGGLFDPESGRMPVDEILRTGEGWGAAQSRELQPGVPLEWAPFVGGLNYGGAGAPGVVDFAAVTFFSGGEFGYGLRWIYSEKERPVLLKIGKQGFAGTAHLETWLNGDVIYSGDPGAVLGKELPAQLKSGWNLLSFKSSFAQWQWQLAIDLQPVEGDNLNNLRFSIVRPDTAG